MNTQSDYAKACQQKVSRDKEDNIFYYYVPTLAPPGYKNPLLDGRPLSNQRSERNKVFDMGGKIKNHSYSTHKGHCSAAKAYLVSKPE